AVRHAKTTFSFWLPVQRTSTPLVRPLHIWRMRVTAESGPLSLACPRAIGWLGTFRLAPGCGGLAAGGTMGIRDRLPARPPSPPAGSPVRGCQFNWSSVTDTGRPDGVISTGFVCGAGGVATTGWSTASGGSCGVATGVATGTGGGVSVGTVTTGGGVI